MRLPRVVAIALLSLPVALGSACATAGHSSSAGGDDAGTGSGDARPPGSPDAQAACLEVDGDTPVTIGQAGTDDDYALSLTALSSSATHWDQDGDQAVVLDVSSRERGVIGQLVLHHGQDAFGYGMSLGRLAAGDEVQVEVSPLSAAQASPGACVGPVTLTAAAELGAAGEGLQHAPILRWPVARRFDGLPVLMGWSATRKDYQVVMTRETGGTVAECGGGSDGIEAEVARWGRAADIESVFSYAGDSPTWDRCTGSTPFTQVTPRMEGDHPIFYYGDSHNRLFESRAGYGRACGSAADQAADGDLEGWNVADPGDQPALDDGLVITLRPLPVALDDLDYGAWSGRRDGLLDRFGPWVYRLTTLELARAGVIDGVHALDLDRYLYLDVHASDVGGSGDLVCSSATGGFRIRAVTTGGQTINGPQITRDFFGTAENWKRVAVPLPAGTSSTDIDHLVFDAYNNDGIYLLGLGDAFMVRPVGEAGAVLEPLHTGVTDLAAYVDDDSSGCSGGVNTDGPGGAAYPCVGSAVDVSLASP